MTILQLSCLQLGRVDAEVKAVASYGFAFAGGMDLQETINTADFFPRHADAPQQLVAADRSAAWPATYATAAPVSSAAWLFLWPVVLRS